ncbi:MAG: hypothetical protein QW356_05690 [Candidatus Hadarchaeales archaeon]
MSSNQSQKFRNKLESLTRKFIKEDIETLIETVQEKEAVDSGLKKIGFWSDLCEHPILKTVLDWGGIGRELKKAEAYKNIQEVLEEIRRKKSVSTEEALRLRQLLNDLRNQIIDFVTKQAGDAGKGLRHIHAPGSAANTEARNAYFGEKYTSEILYEMATCLASSVCVGKHVGVYFENEETRKYLEQLCLQYFKSGWSISPEEIGISRYEIDRPYLILMKFLLWLWDQISTEKEPERKELLQNLARQIKQSSAVLYFTPGNDRVRWRTITIPRLDFFITKWVENEERRRKIQQLTKDLTHLMNNVSQRARQMGERAVENTIELIMMKYEAFAQKLLEFGIPEYHALYSMVTSAMDVSIHYGIPQTLTYIKWLT